MQTVTVVAREAFPYAGIPRRVGESFEATAEDARILKLIGRVGDPPAPSYVPASAPEEAVTPRTRTRRQREPLTDAE